MSHKPSKTTLKSESGEQWRVIPGSTAGLDVDSSGLSPAFAAVIGKQEYYSDPTLGAWGNPTDTVVMFIEEHAPGKWHNVEYGLVAGASVEGWELNEFEVGGPEPIRGAVK